MKLGITVGVLALSMIAGAAMAQPYYLRGDFNGWGTTTPMTDMGGGMYQATATGMTAGSIIELKAAVADWSFAAPSNANSNGTYGNNLRMKVASSVTYNFFPAISWSDGWSPSTTNRIGFVDPGLHGWDLLGDFNGWSASAMTNLGNGLYKLSVAAAPGAYEFKFRPEGDWDRAFGSTFEKNGTNASATVNAGDTGLDVYLDLPNGRWQALSVPTPGALALMGLGGLVAARRRR